MDTSKLQATQFDYCKNRCGAQCCRYLHPEEGEVTCPKLDADNSCSVYRQRFEGPLAEEAVVQVGWVPSKKLKGLNGLPAARPFWCGKLKDIHARGGLPQAVADKCCVLHPELLEKWETMR